MAPAKRPTKKQSPRKPGTVRAKRSFVPGNPAHGDIAEGAEFPADHQVVRDHPAEFEAVK